MRERRVRNGRECRQRGVPSLAELKCPGPGEFFQIDDVVKKTVQEGCTYLSGDQHRQNYRWESTPLFVLEKGNKFMTCTRDAARAATS